MNRSERKDLALVLIVAFLASLVWVVTKRRTIDGDDAILGLMALKISQGKEFPVFMWQNQFFGPIASYLAAPLHWLFKPSPIVLQSVIIPIHTFYSAGMYFLAKTWLGQREAMLVGLFAALPGQLFPYSALGGFTESMAFVPWIFLLCLNKPEGNKKRERRFFWGGFLCGFALWVFPLAFPPILACFICQYKVYGGKALKLSLVGCLLGLLSVIYYNLMQPGATFLRLFSRPSALDRQAAIQLLSSEGILSFFLHVLERWAIGSFYAFLNITLFTFSLMGFTPGATVLGYISGAITFFALLFGLWTCFRYKGKAQAIPPAIALTVIITYCFLIVFGLNRDRYLIPILLIVPFGLAYGISRLAAFLSWRVGAVVIASLLLLNALANFREIKLQYPDYEGLARFLESKNLARGYAPYDAAYPLVYLSNERLIYTPAFEDPKYDRRTEYTACVAQAKNLTFVFANKNSADRFKRGLATLNTSSKKQLWGPFTIFHDLTSRVDIERLASETVRPTD